MAQDICDTCDGAGWVKAPAWYKCVDCNGTGETNA